MKDADVLALAMNAQTVAGKPDVTIQIELPRHPSSQYVRHLKYEPKSGPAGTLVRVTDKGSVAAFRADQLVEYLQRKGLRAQGIELARRNIGGHAPEGGKLKRSTIGRRQIHPNLRVDLIEELTGLALLQNRAMSHLVEDAIGEYVERRNMENFHAVTGSSAVDSADEHNDTGTANGGRVRRNGKRGRNGLVSEPAADSRTNPYSGEPHIHSGHSGHERDSASA